MAARQGTWGNRQFLDDSGNPLDSGNVYFYVPGTTTDKAVYTTIGKASTHSNPIVLDSAGRFQADVFFDGIYDVIVKDSSGNTIDTYTNWGEDWTAVASQYSIIQNPSAEVDDDSDSVPDNWTATTNSSDTLTRDNTDASHGDSSFKITGNNASYWTSDPFEVSDLYTYTLSFLTKASNADADIEIQIEWLDESQSTLGTDTITTIASGSMPTSWTYKGTFAAVPDSGANFGKLHAIGNSAGTSRSVWFDNFILWNDAVGGGGGTVEVADAVSTDTTISSGDVTGVGHYILPVDISGGSVNVTLPALSDYEDVVIEVVVINDAGTASSNQLIVKNSGGTAQHYGFQTNDFFMVTSDGTNQRTLDEKMTLAFSVDLSTDQALTQSTWELIAWDNELYDIGGLHSSGTFTVPTGGDGVWLFTWSMEMTGLADGNGCDFALYIDGTVYKWITDTEAAENSADEIQGGAVELALTATQTVKLYARTEGTGDAVNADVASFFTGRWMRET